MPISTRTCCASLAASSSSAARTLDRFSSQQRSPTTRGTTRPCLVVPRLNEFDFFLTGHPEFSGVSDISVHLDDELVRAKVHALREHESQMEPLFEAYGEDFFRSILSTEVYRSGVRSALPFEDASRPQARVASDRGRRLRKELRCFACRHHL